MVGAAELDALASPHKIATANNCLSPADKSSVLMSLFFWSLINKSKLIVSILIDFIKCFFL